jgi:hypothetical protein
MSAVMAGMLGAGALLLAVPGVSSAAVEDGLDIHGWRIDNASNAVFVVTENGQNGLDIHGWSIDTAGEAERVASSDSPYMGASMQVGAVGELGFTDPRPGQGDYERSPYTGTSMQVDAVEELGFTDPRPGQGDY